MCRIRAVVVSLIAIALATPALASAQGTRPFSVEDLIAMERISDPQLSPDGRWVVFTISSLDWEANRRRTDLWMVGIDG
ncbi:MAG: S9 family peptidase, partial [Gemmatimonadota bacterium]